MTIDRTLAISSRIVLQMSHDHRSIALVIVAPVMVMALVGFSWSQLGLFSKSVRFQQSARGEIVA